MLTNGEVDTEYQRDKENQNECCNNQYGQLSFFSDLPQGILQGEGAPLKIFSQRQNHQNSRDKVHQDELSDGHQKQIYTYAFHMPGNFKVLQEMLQHVPDIQIGSTDHKAGNNDGILADQLFIGFAAQV